MGSTISQTIGFVGAGQMARALAGGLVEGGLVEGSQIRACDPAAAARDRFLEAVHDASTSSDASEVAGSDVVFLAVKPQYMAGVLDELKPRIGPGQLVVSIAAGITIDAIQSALAHGVRLVRVMPNTPCLVRKGACGYSLASTATETDGQLVRELLSAVGMAVQVDEKHLDAVTGLSGSGPAYVFVAIEALADGGVAMGLPRDVSVQLAAQTVVGAAAMVAEGGGHPGELKDQVTSPGGTTIAGLKALEDRGLRAAFMAAVEAATERCRELGDAAN
ncbi:MAG: pyrroline-5-carboxylate reductase [Pirellulales bacterium]|nr:pyrroline-5-carboxylate reductase [Pirellulales bacterium]